MFIDKPTGKDANNAHTDNIKKCLLKIGGLDIISLG